MSVESAVSKIEEDEKSWDFLEAVRYYGGEASTTDIRKRTGLTQPETQYRFKKLKELELINVRKAESGRGDREPPRVARITPKGNQVLETREQDDSQGLEGADISEQEIVELEEKITKLENRIDVITYTTDVSNGDESGESNGSLEERLAELERRIEESRDGVADTTEETDVSKERAVRRVSSRVSELEGRVEDLEGYLFEWTESAELYLVALRRIIEQETEMSFDEYLRRVDEDENSGL
jgi:DNA-binding MarR family transcriptional regulator